MMAAADPKTPPHVALHHAGDWSAFRADLEALAADALAAAAAVLAASEPEARDDALGRETAVVFADDATVRALNARYRGKDAATNVLAFPTDSPPGVASASTSEPPALGDVVLAVETIWAEAHDQGGRPGDHLTHLIIHGYLHLRGYDHQTDDEAHIMQSLERAALARLGRPDPYSGCAPPRRRADADGPSEPAAAPEPRALVDRVED